MDHLGASLRSHLASVSTIHNDDTFNSFQLDVLCQAGNITPDSTVARSFADRPRSPGTDACKTKSDKSVGGYTETDSWGSMASDVDCESKPKSCFFKRQKGSYQSCLGPKEGSRCTPNRR